jgi:hypothetical protein
LSLCNPNTCLNWTDSSVPKGFGLDRFYCTFIMKRMFKQWWSTIPPISNCMFYCLANLVRHNVNTCNPFTYLGSKFNYYLFQRSLTCLDIDKCIMNNLLCYFLYLRIDLNFFSVLEEINSKMWYTCETQGCVPNFLVYFEWTEQKIVIIFSVHEEINSKIWYTLCNPQSGLRKGVYHIFEFISNEPNKKLWSIRIN